MWTTGTRRIACSSSCTALHRRRRAAARSTTRRRRPSSSTNHTTRQRLRVRGGHRRGIFRISSCARIFDDAQARPRRDAARLHRAPVARARLRARRGHRRALRRHRPDRRLLGRVHHPRHGSTTSSRAARSASRSFRSIRAISSEGNEAEGNRIFSIILDDDDGRGRRRRHRPRDLHTADHAQPICTSCSLRDLGSRGAPDAHSACRRSSASTSAGWPRPRSTRAIASSRRRSPPLIYNFGTIAGGALLGRRYGIASLAWVTLAGAFIGHLTLQLIAAGRAGLRWRPSLRCEPSAVSGAGSSSACRS